MIARGGTALAVAVAMAGAALAADSGNALPADPSTLTYAPPAAQHEARERPRGVVLGCHTQSGLGAGLSEFHSRWNLVVGPLAMRGAAARPGHYSQSFGGNKFPVNVKGGSRVTVAVARHAWPEAGLLYGPRPQRSRDVRDGYRVVTFIACRRGEISGRFDGWPVSFWSGGVLARSPRCVPLLVWVGDAPSPRRAVVHLGVRDCE